MSRYFTRNNWKEGTYMRVKDPTTIRMLMDSKSLAVRDIARLSTGTSYEVRHAAVGHVVSGFRSTINPKTATAIANALHVSVESLFDIENDRDREWINAYANSLKAVA